MARHYATSPGTTRMLKRFISVNRLCSEYLLRRIPSFFDSPSNEEELKRRIQHNIIDLRPGRIIEIGGIDRPLISRNDAYTYIGVDIEVNDRCHEIYDQFIVQTIEKPLDLSARMLISITLLEHVRDNRAAIASIAEALEPDGTTHHYIPSKWHPYSIVLRMVGPVAQRKLIRILRPNAESVTGYPSFFDHCSTRAMRKLFAENGLVAIETKAYYRANDYFAFFVPAYILISLFENICRALKLELFASGFVISARKPSSSD
jgi:hypothetical protein